MTEINSSTFYKQMRKTMFEFCKVPIYCLIGCLVNHWLYGPNDWGQITTYGVTVFWPIVLLWHFSLFLLWLAFFIAVGIVSAFILVYCCETLLPNIWYQLKYFWWRYMTKEEKFVPYKNRHGFGSVHKLRGVN